MKNKMKRTVLALVVLASAGHAMAADSVDVKVIGTITPSACTPSLSGGGTVDYGNIKANTLSPSSYTTLPTKNVDFSITCSAPTKVGVSVVNGRPGTLAGATVDDTATQGGMPPSPLGGAFYNGAVGLGLADNAKIGGYTIAFTPGSFTADGNQVNSIYRRSTDPSWRDASYSGAAYNYAYGMTNSWRASGQSDPVAFMNLNGSLKVLTYLNKASELDLTKQINLDGLTTLELVYL